MATGAGTGYFPCFPGTVGTLLAVPLSLALNRIATASLPLSLLTLVAFVVGAAWFCQKGEEILREKDSPRIVIDEIGGFLLANFLSPPEFTPAAVAFLLFRFFDIIKIFPAGQAQKLPGGVGVMLDDLIAGCYTFLILRLLFSWSLL
ncbi:MAG: phosphatidylglycerophosphatase A [Deltaproteobacteria bacterium]|nr:phosphatidylglycerophosphatase A [Deltaproteobacteria bacterium]